MQTLPDWLTLHRGQAPLLISFPHTGTDFPPELAGRYASPWLAQRDADWWVQHLYGFAAEALGATTLRTSISRSVIDVNRDPSGASLYPGQNTTGLCPLSSFDGEPLYRPGQAPDAEEIAQRRLRWFDPYHAALRAEIQRLRAIHPCVVVYDAHSIRSHIPHLFEGELPQFNIGSHQDRACDPALADAIERVCADSGMSHVRNGRFQGGWITRHYGAPAEGVHAIQMELACRGYMEEPDVPAPGNWPTSWLPERAAPLRAVLCQVLRTCLQFAGASVPPSPSSPRNTA